MPHTSKTPPHPPDKQARIDAARQHYRTRAQRRTTRQTWDPQYGWIKQDMPGGQWYVPDDRYAEQVAERLVAQVCAS